MTWRDQANCRDLSTSLFFETDVMSRYAPEVKEACAGCEVRRDCLMWALKHEKHGFWGGTTEVDRRRMRRRRMRERTHA